jgi:type VI protein secretion system component VasF
MALAGRHQGETGVRQRSLRSLMWTLCAILVLILVVLMMWIRYSQDKTSTVDPTKTPPPASQ